MNAALMLPAPAARGWQRRLSDLLYTRRGLLLLALLAPPLLWFGVVYLGSLLALLANAFFGLDDYTGQVVREFTLQNFRDLGDPANLDVVRRSVTMSVLVTLACVGLGFPLAYYMARHASGVQKARALHRGDAAAVVELPGAPVRVEAAARQGRRDLLAGTADAPGLDARRACWRCRRSAGRA